MHGEDAMTAGRKEEQESRLPAIVPIVPKNLKQELEDVPPCSSAMVALRNSKRKPTALLRKDTLAAARARIAEALTRPEGPDEFEVTTTTWKVERVKSRVRAVKGKDGERKPGLLAPGKELDRSRTTREWSQRTVTPLSKDSAGDRTPRTSIQLKETETRFNHRVEEDTKPVGLLAHTRNKLPAVASENSPAERPRGLLGKNTSKPSLGTGRKRSHKLFHKERKATCTTDEDGSKWRLQERYNAAMREVDEKTSVKDGETHTDKKITSGRETGARARSGTGPLPGIEGGLPAFMAQKDPPSLLTSD